MNKKNLKGQFFLLSLTLEITKEFKKWWQNIFKFIEGKSEKLIGK